MFKLLLLALPLLSVFFTQAHCSAADRVPSLATGIKIGEVSQDRAKIWVRLCAVSQANPSSIEKAAPGSAGNVQIRYWPLAQKQKLIQTELSSVDPDRDFTCQIELTDLSPNTTYIAETLAFSEQGVLTDQVSSRFKTAPSANQVCDVNAVVVTCQGHETTDDPRSGHWVYSDMLRRKPDFLIHTGDVVYYDKGKAHPYSTTVAAARQRWNRMFSYTWNREFYTQVPSYFMKDDHDTLKNDCWPGQSYGNITWADGLALFCEQTPQGAKPYRKIRWGKDLEFWLIEGRDYRSPNPQPDGPGKTILGKEQKEWLKQTIQQSDATFKLVIFPSPVVGPDKKGKKDNHSNPNFNHEGNELRQFLSSIPNTYVVCGDRHWQYASKDPQTKLIEIGCGPINNAHAKRGGNAKANPKYHLYYGGGKGGYLRIRISRKGSQPQLSFIWHGDRSSAGAINHQLTFPVKLPDHTSRDERDSPAH